MQEFIEMCQKLGIKIESGRFSEEHLFVVTKDQKGSEIAYYFFKDTDKAEYVTCRKHIKL